MKILLLSLILALSLPRVLSHADISQPISPQLSSSTLPVQNLVIHQQPPHTIELTPIIIKKSTKQATQKKNVRTSNYREFLSYATSEEYTLKKKVRLVKASTTRNKRAIMFVFLMNKPKEERSLEEISVDSRKRMHIMWPGSRRALKKQEVIDDRYPIDVSIDNYSEGYAAREWNIVLPNKKPKEISIALLWTF